jgi:hypothetical protein
LRSKSDSFRLFFKLLAAKICHLLAELWVGTFNSQFKFKSKWKFYQKKKFTSIQKHSERTIGFVRRSSFVTCLFIQLSCYFRQLAPSRARNNAGHFVSSRQIYSSSNQIIQTCKLPTASSNRVFRFWFIY